MVGEGGNREKRDNDEKSEFSDRLVAINRTLGQKAR